MSASASVVPAAGSVAAPSVVVPSAGAAPSAGSAGSVTTGGAAFSVPAFSVPAAGGAPWARTDVSGSAGRIGVVVVVRFGSVTSGGVSATTACSIRCWSASRLWPSSSPTLCSDALTASSSWMATSRCPRLSASWARSSPADTTCAAMIDRARFAKNTSEIAQAGSPGIAVPPLAAAPLSPSATTTTATAARRRGCPGGSDCPAGRARRRNLRVRESRPATDAAVRGRPAAAGAAAAAPATRRTGPAGSPESARGGGPALGRSPAAGSSLTVGRSRSGKSEVSWESVSPAPVSPGSMVPAPTSVDPPAGSESGEPADAVPAVSPTGASATGRRSGASVASWSTQAVSSAIGEAISASGRALAAQAASMAMRGSSGSTRSSAPVRSPPPRASMSASSARTAARSIGSSLSRGSNSRSS